MFLKRWQKTTAKPRERMKKAKKHTNVCDTQKKNGIIEA